MKLFNYDRDFIKTLKKGIPECAGIAVGILTVFRPVDDQFRVGEGVEEVLQAGQLLAMPSPSPGRA